jgi:metallo-beta-lactamase family protein
MKLTFLGAAGTVTGSKTVLDVGDQRIMVDCGLFQGLKELRLRNWERLPGAATIDRVLLTHAHLDHSGYLPLLLRQGFAGKIYCTPPTKELLRILLLDFARLSAEDARLANRLGFSRHKKAEPLYRQEDVIKTLRRVEVLSPDAWHQFGPGVKVRLRENGHIVGSVFAEFHSDRHRIVFSGDLGRRHPLLLRPPKVPPRADAVVLESTYGDRNHPHARPEDELEKVILRTWKRGGRLLIPVFAVGRSQDVLYLLSRLKSAGRIPDIPIYLDSPMAIEVSEVSCRYLEWQKLERKEARAMFAGVRLVHSARESQSLRRKGKPAIVLAGSGMATGGRILSHFEDCLPDPRHTILLVGYQAPGTRGRLMLDGCPEIKLHGMHFPVRAEIAQIGSLSAHADREELLHWLGAIGGSPKVYLNHGEPQATDSLRLAIRDRLGLEVELARPGRLG